jgi:hypothetical protein
MNLPFNAELLIDDPSSFCAHRRALFGMSK